VVEIKALACQLPKDLGLPFSRLSRDDIAQQAVHRGIVASISGATVWRWLSADAIRPWCYRSWIWPRAPHFEQKAGCILDLYHGIWNGKTLGDNDFVISSDEKTSIQARRRLVPTTPSTVGRVARVEQDSLQYVFQYNQDELDHMMENLCEKAGVKHFGFHAIRHHVAGVINDSKKASMKQIQGLLGHKHQSTTEEYLHFIGSALYDAAGVLDGETEKEAGKTEMVPQVVPQGS
jgi:hypothetical protein